MSPDERRLTRLSDLSGYKVASGDPDPRGWEVVTQEGIPVGRVDDLIVDQEHERARYLDVRLGEPGEAERHVLVPADAVHIGQDEKQQHRVEVGASLQYFAGVTPYTGLPLAGSQQTEYDACPPPIAREGAPRMTRITRSEAGDDRNSNRT